jgi:hypothetical protein
MEASLFYYHSPHWLPHSQKQMNDARMADLVLCFGPKDHLANPDVFTLARVAFINAQIALCSTAGEIWQDHMRDELVLAAALQLSKTQVEAVTVDIGNYDNTFAAAIALTRQLPNQTMTITSFYAY